MEIRSNDASPQRAHAPVDACATSCSPHCQKPGNGNVRPPLLDLQQYSGKSAGSDEASAGGARHVGLSYAAGRPGIEQFTSYDSAIVKKAKARARARASNHPRARARARIALPGMHPSR